MAIPSARALAFGRAAKMRLAASRFDRLSQEERTLNDDIASQSEQLCSGLAELGCEFHWEADNRGGFKTRYIFVRRPVAIKIRVSDHRSERIAKDMKRSRTLTIDVGKHATTWQEALVQIADALKS